MRGHQSAGILMGKRNLIAAARLNAPPMSGIARGQKVNKEEILGMYVTVERYINLDHEKEWRLWEDQVALIEKTAKGVDGVMTTVFVPPVANHTPTLNIYWAKDRINISGNDLRQRLRDGSPSIEVRNGENDGIELTVFMLKPGQERIVAQRISEELRSI